MYADCCAEIGRPASVIFGLAWNDKCFLEDMVTATYTENRKKKKVVFRNYRHWGVTVVLTALAAINAIAVIAYILGAISSEARVNTRIYLLFAAFSAVSLVCLAALFKWQKWGFWGLCAMSLISLLVSSFLHLYDIGSSFGGLFVCLLLYGTLQYGGKYSGWRQLK